MASGWSIANEFEAEPGFATTSHRKVAQRNKKPCVISAPRGCQHAVQLLQKLWHVSRLQDRRPIPIDAVCKSKRLVLWPRESVEGVAGIQKSCEHVTLEVTELHFYRHANIVRSVRRVLSGTHPVGLRA